MCASVHIHQCDSLCWCGVEPALLAITGFFLDRPIENELLGNIPLQMKMFCL